jgi:hypothetical protein
MYFLHILICPHQNTLFEMRLLSTREAREIKNVTEGKCVVLTVAAEEGRQRK